MKSIHFNWRFLAQLPYVLLVERFMLVRLLLLVGLFLIAGAVVVTLLYLQSDSVSDIGTKRTLLLDTQTIDELEVWIEERQSERERPITGEQREYFKR